MLYRLFFWRRLTGLGSLLFLLLLLYVFLHRTYVLLHFAGGPEHRDQEFENEFVYEIDSEYEKKCT